MNFLKATCIISKQVLRCHQMLRTKLASPANEHADSFPICHLGLKGSEAFLPQHEERDYFL